MLDLSFPRSSRRSLALAATLAVGMIAAHADAQYALYGQRESAWGNDRVGYSSDLMRNTGCLVTAIAMANSRFGWSLNPGQMNLWGKGNGMFSGGLVVWARSPNYRSTLDYRNVAANLAVIRQKLDQGYALVAETRLAGSMHWVLLTGYDGAGRLIMQDPYYKDRMPFVNRYGGEARNIYRVALYRSY